jgi:integrase/recombinase XerC
MPILPTDVTSRASISAEQPESHLASLAPTVAEELQALVRARFRNPETRRAYQRAVFAFATFLRVPPSVVAVVQLLVVLGPARTSIAAESWLGSMESAGLSASTRRLRIAALRAVWAIARKVGAAVWPIDVRGPAIEALRDTRGPGIVGLRKMLQAAAKHGGERGLRDVVLLDLLGVLGQRRSEPLGCDVRHFDRPGRRLLIHGKGRSEREWVTLPATVSDALAAYLDARQARAEEPLFTRLDPSARGKAQRLSAAGLYRIVRELGVEAGIEAPVSPHRLRHAAITAALDGTSGDVRRVRLFSRHVKLQTILTYDDHRTDAAGEVATLVAAAVGADLVRGTAPVALDSRAEPAGVPLAEEAAPRAWEISVTERSVVDVSVPKPRVSRE